MSHKDLLKGVAKGSKMPSNRQERFKDMCLKLAGTPKETHSKLKCEVGEDELELEKDWTRASVNSAIEGKDHHVRGSLQQPNNIEMMMIGNPEEEDEVMKSIRVKGTDNQISISSFVPTQ